MKQHHPYSSMKPEETARARILLAYVSYPVTTAVYFERGLRAHHQVVTVGPTMDEELIKTWNLENMHLPVRDLDIPAPYDMDLEGLLERLPRDMWPDLYLWVESIAGYFPQNLEKVRIPKACYLIDSHLKLHWHTRWARQFDHVFIAQREYLQAFRDAGNTSVHWLPLGCDPDIHRKTTSEKTHPIGFVGSLNTERRVQLLNRLQKRIPVAFERCFWDDMADFFSRSTMVFNNAIKDDLNMRVFEVLSTGTFLFSDCARNSGQETLFRGDEDFGEYTDDTILEVAEHYLSHDIERERIAARGQQLVHRAHTYAHRVDDLVQVALGGKPTTWSAEELRAQSTSGLPAAPAPVRAIRLPEGKPRRSFVIPVLDMSPASPYNITTLLEDLKNVEGDVIVVFNAPGMADQLRGHPRIDYAATMSHNVGVSRAWNIGLAMSQAPVTFILNADLHVEPSVFDVLETALTELPDAAVVGPQGGFFHFERAQDLVYFKQGAAVTPVRVDAVAGFLFCVRTEAFGPGGFQFDSRFTPCYFEEWDLGLQCRRAGARCYVVPATEYAHEWSGTIRGLRTIRYFRSEATAREILERNRAAFHTKWKHIVEETGDPSILQSLWVDYSRHRAAAMRSAGNGDDADHLLGEMSTLYPGCVQDMVPAAALV